MEQVTLIRRSLTIFVCGLIGAVPILGVPPALYALVSAVRTHFASGQTWNPASRYLAAGALLACAGIGLSVLIVGAAIVSH